MSDTFLIIWLCIAPIFVCFILPVGLGIAFRNKKMLMMINFFWWLLSLLSAFVLVATWIANKSIRVVSMDYLLLLFMVLPYSLLVIIGSLTLLPVARKIPGPQKLKQSFYFLIAFLAVQAVAVVLPYVLPYRPIAPDLLIH